MIDAGFKATFDLMWAKLDDIDKQVLVDSMLEPYKRQKSLLECSPDACVAYNDYIEFLGYVVDTLTNFTPSGGGGT